MDKIDYILTLFTLLALVFYIIFLDNSNNKLEKEMNTKINYHNSNWIKNDINLSKKDDNATKEEHIIYMLKKK